jgi:hypothetical protein
MAAGECQTGNKNDYDDVSSSIIICIVSLVPFVFFLSNMTVDYESCCCALI